jgi:colanic acid/amylovoran biosynthesis glycosyltransferase
VPAVLEIIGYGELEAELRETAATPGTNNVRFLGQQSHAAVLERMATSDVFILPSVTASSGDMEGIPVSLMEAMIRGCLVISTRHSGISELVDHERSGLLVAERSPDDIASALTRIASGAIDVASFRRSARAAVVADFDNHKLDVELLDILSSLSRDGAISGQLRGAG